MVTIMDKFRTCKENIWLAEVIHYQTHRHASTCRKKGKSVCHFGFPLSLTPLEKSMILHGFDEKKTMKFLKQRKFL